MSGSTQVGGIAVPIFAVDKATVVINRVTKNIAKMVPQTQRFSQATNQAGSGVFGINRLAQGMQGLGFHTQTALRAFERIVPALGLLSAAGSLGGIVALENHFANIGQSIGNLGQRLGVPVDRLTELQGAARLGGVSATDMASGLTALDEALRGATFRGDGLKIQTFNALRVRFGEMGSQARTADDAIGDVADGIKRLNDEQGRGAALRAAQNLGLEGLFPILVRGKAALEAWQARVKSLGGVLTPEMIDRAEKLREGFQSVGIAVEGFANKVTDALAPVFTPVLNSMADWIGRNSTWIAQDIGGCVKKLATAIGSIDWEPAKKGANEFFNWLKQIAETNFDKVKETIKTITTPPGTPGEDKSQAAQEQRAGWAKLKEYWDRLVKWGHSDEPLPFGFHLPDWSHLVPDGSDSSRDVSRGPITDFFLRYPSLDPTNYNLMPHINPHFGGTPIRGKPAQLDPKIEAEVRRDARLGGLDEDHMVALFRQEHGGFANVSPKGNFGPAQLGKATADKWGVANSVFDPNYDWRKNVLAGISEYSELLRRFGEYDVADAGYNAGPNNKGVKLFARTHNQVGLPQETQEYIRSIQEMTGEVHVTVDINTQPGTTVKAGATASGRATTSPPRVATPMAGAGAVSMPVPSF